MLASYCSKAGYLGGLGDRYYRRGHNSRLQKCQLECGHTWGGARTLGKMGGGTTVLTEGSGGAVRVAVRGGGLGGGGGGGVVVGF